MKLYTKPGACSTAIHIDLCWTGQPFEVQVMDADSMKADAFRALNPSGAVPVLVDSTPATIAATPTTPSAAPARVRRRSVPTGEACSSRIAATGGTVAARRAGA